MTLPIDSTSKLEKRIVLRRWRYSHSLLLAAAVFYLILFALLTGYARRTVQRREKLSDPEEILRAVIEETDRFDPGWRWEELQAKRSVVRDAENSALCVLAACERKPKDWPTWRSLDRLVGQELPREARWKYEWGIRGLAPNVQLNAQQLEILQMELSGADATLTEARKLSDLSRGRFPRGEPKKPLIPTPSPPTNPLACKPRELIDLLTFDIWVRTQQGDFCNALASCRAMVNAGRAVGDELDTAAQLVRLSCAGNALRHLERVLAHGDAPSGDLLKVQQLLEDEAEAPVLLNVARCSRAESFLVLEGIQQGRYSAEELENIDKLEDTWRKMLSGLWDLAGEKDEAEEENAIKWYAPERIVVSRIWTLRFTNALVEICQRQDWEQAEALAQLKERLRGQPYSSRLFGESLIHLQTSCCRIRADLRCAAVALAMERYRQANHRWPESLDALVPGHIKAVPLDPFDGQPLRYRREWQGVIVYSVGPDRKDDLGHFRWPNKMDLDRDIGFRMADPEWRRLPPPPVQPPDQIAEPEHEGPP